MKSQCQVCKTKEKNYIGRDQFFKYELYNIARGGIV
jgi:hypothetical protein